MAKSNKTKARTQGKVRNKFLTADYLTNRANHTMNAGFSKPRWITFCEDMMARGFQVKLYEAKRTVSKYVTVVGSCGREFKVRFSDHKPIMRREVEGDCDFFVGVTNLGVTNTTHAIMETLMFFNNNRS